MTTTRPAAMPAKVARAARSAAGDGEGKLPSSAWTATRHPRSVKPATISRS